MFSNLNHNSILHIWDIKGNPKILSGQIERISIPRAKHDSFSQNFETVVDIIAMINGESREFKDVPNNSVAEFGEDKFVLAESRDILEAFIRSKCQNAKGIIENSKKQQELLPLYEEALDEINPNLKADKEKDKVISSLQEQITEMKEMITKLCNREIKN
jgi:hypothetical protein